MLTGETQGKLLELPFEDDLLFITSLKGFSVPYEGCETAYPILFASWERSTCWLCLQPPQFFDDLLIDSAFQPHDTH
ncbi:UNVERIFIED_CONTAM: hypothetical protein FKN15_009567 [Acipenser sinensis]